MLSTRQESAQQIVTDGCVLARMVLPEQANKACPGVREGLAKRVTILQQRLARQWRSALRYYGLLCRGPAGGRSCCRDHCCMHWSTWWARWCSGARPRLQWRPWPCCAPGTALQSSLALLLGERGAARQNLPFACCWPSVWDCIYPTLSHNQKLCIQAWTPSHKNNCAVSFN